MAERISLGLKRKAITSCSTWAETYRVMGGDFPGPWSFKYHAWAREMHDCECEFMIGQKAAQMAFTETAMNKVFYNMDMRGVSCLYVLPAKNPDAANFSTSRFDPALELSEHLRKMFVDVKNIGHKRAGSANLFIMGSRSRSQLKSNPVGLAIADEVDEMVEDNLPLIFERMSGQLKKQAFFLSTPTADNCGINAYYKQSTEEHWFFKCPHCSRSIEFVFPQSLIVCGDSNIDPAVKLSHFICTECKATIGQEEKVIAVSGGLWVPNYQNRDSRGFYVNQMYSVAKDAAHLAKKVIAARYNIADEQELYNSSMGLPHITEDARINDKMIENCIGDYQEYTSHAGMSGYFITMGVDVGKFIYYEIDMWIPVSAGSDVNLVSIPKVAKTGYVTTFEELDDIIYNYQVCFVVIDANPERRKAIEFSNRFPGHVKLCFYGNGVNGRTINEHDNGENTITVDRTTWMDLAINRFKTARIKLPTNISGEYKSHIKEPIRVAEKDADGNIVGRYVTEQNKHDHLAHARTYAEIALTLSAGIATSHDINEDDL